MSGREDEATDAWGGLDPVEESRKRHEVIRKRGARGDRMLLLFLVPGGFFLIGGGCLTTFVLRGSGGVIGIGAAVLGFAGLMVACKILLGKR